MSLECKIRNVNHKKCISNFKKVKKKKGGNGGKLKGKEKFPKAIFQIFNDYANNYEFLKRIIDYKYIQYNKLNFYLQISVISFLFDTVVLSRKAGV